MKKPILILLPSVQDTNVFEWVEGIDTGEEDSSPFGGSGANVEARGGIWRGCNALCLLPLASTEDQKRERLNQVLEKMGHKQS